MTHLTPALSPLKGGEGVLTVGRLCGLFLLLLAMSVPAHAGAMSFMKSAHGFALCSAADVGSTVAAIQHGAVETNGLWADSVNQHNYAPLFLGNLLVVGLAYAYEDEIHPNVFLFVNVLRCAVAGANLRFVF